MFSANERDMRAIQTFIPASRTKESLRTNTRSMFSDWCGWFAGSGPWRDESPSKDLSDDNQWSLRNSEWLCFGSSSRPCPPGSEGQQLLQRGPNIWQKGRKVEVLSGRLLAETAAPRITYDGACHSQQRRWTARRTAPQTEESSVSFL